MSKKTKPPSASLTEWGRMGARLRWKGVPPKERTRIMTEIGKQGGRPKESKRCFCGQFTMRRAASRSFDCCRKAGVLKLEEASGVRESARPASPR
jgi:hypothetical protein